MLEMQTTIISPGKFYKVKFTYIFHTPLMNVGLYQCLVLVFFFPRNTARIYLYVLFIYFGVLNLKSLPWSASLISTCPCTDFVLISRGIVTI